MPKIIENVREQLLAEAKKQIAEEKSVGKKETAEPVKAATSTVPGISIDVAVDDE